MSRRINPHLKVANEEGRSLFISVDDELYRQYKTRKTFLLCIKGSPAEAMSAVESRNFSHPKMGDPGKAIERVCTVYVANTEKNKSMAIAWYAASNDHDIRKGGWPIGTLLFWNEEK